MIWISRITPNNRRRDLLFYSCTQKLLPCRNCRKLNYLKTAFEYTLVDSIIFLSVTYSLPFEWLWIRIVIESSWERWWYHKQLTWSENCECQSNRSTSTTSRRDHPLNLCSRSMADTYDLDKAFRWRVKQLEVRFHSFPFVKSVKSTTCWSITNRRLDMVNEGKRKRKVWQSQCDCGRLSILDESWCMRISAGSGFSFRQADISRWTCRR